MHKLLGGLYIHHVKFHNNDGNDDDDDDDDNDNKSAVVWKYGSSSKFM